MILTVDKYREDLENFSALDFYFSEFLSKKESISDERAKHALTFLFYQSRNGHLCVNSENISSPLFSDDFLQLIKEGFSQLKNCKAVVEYKDCYYLHKNWVIENHVVDEVKRLQIGSSLLSTNISFKLESEKLLEKKIISKEQFALFEKCLEKKLIFLSGGPGSGKTYTASRLLEVIAKTLNNLKVIVTAPTGKAVSNLQEKTANLKLDFEYQAKTMHSLLKLYELQNLNFSSSKISADLIIIDEASMIDAFLFALFLSAIGDKTTVIFMGDQDQLPPVEGGCPFADIVTSRKDLCVELTTSHRFKNSYLVNLLKEGDSAEFLNEIKAKKIHEEGVFDKVPDNVLSHVVSLVEKHLIVHSFQKIDPEKTLEVFENFRFLNCIRQGNYGVDAINHELYSFFTKKFSGYNFAYPILITENNFQMKLFNGMTGIIIKEKDIENAYFIIDNQLKVFPKLSLPCYELGFVISVHKSQGSEYDNICIIIPPGSEKFGKEVLYTAITRAKFNVKILGPLPVIEATIKNLGTKKSLIGQRLSQ